MSGSDDHWTEVIDLIVTPHLGGWESPPKLSFDAWIRAQPGAISHALTVPHFI